MEVISAMFARALLSALALLLVLFSTAPASAKPTIACTGAAGCPALTKIEPFDLRVAADFCAAGAVGAGPLKLLYEDNDGNRIPEAAECKASAGAAGEFTCTFLPAGVTVARTGTLSTSVCTPKKKLVLTALPPLEDESEAAEPAADTGAPSNRSAGKKPKTAAPEAGEAKLGFLPPGLWKEAIALLDLPLAGHRLGHYYDQKNDVAVLFFDADATPYFPLLDVIDEDDDIYVAIVDYKTRLQGAKVSITGCDRPPVEPRILGKLSDVRGRTVGKAERDQPPPEVGIIFRAFGKCAGADSGGPQLTIERNDEQKVATVSVNQLYRLAVGLAFGYDTTPTRTFAARAPAGSSVTRVAESKDRLGVTPLVFVSFYPVARDFRKTNALAQRFQLVVGMDTENFLDNIVLGAGYELTMGLNVIVGWRALSKQKVLAEGSGLKNGSTFDGTTETLPLRERWTTGGAFLGFGLNDDLLSRLK